MENKTHGAKAATPNQTAQSKPATTAKPAQKPGQKTAGATDKKK